MKTYHLPALFLILNICVLLLMSAGHYDQQTFDKITVKEFELVDANGKPRVSIKIEPDGEAVFRMMDRTGTIRVKVAAGEDGSGLVLLDGSTEPAIHALAKKDGGKLTLRDRNGKKKELSAN
jgi:hypothetical protein